MNKALPLLAATFLCVTSAAAQDKPCKQQRIPIAIGSDFQLEPVCVNFPDQSKPNDTWKDVGEPRVISFKPDPAPNPAAEPSRPRKPNKDRDACITDASKRPSDTGVRVALGECYKKYGKE